MRRHVNGIGRAGLVRPERGFATIAAIASGETGADDPQYYKTTLANGVRVVTGPMSGVRSASLIFYYNIGSRYEPDPIAGVSHFLEHMLFKGTEKRPDPMTISEEIESVGGMLNAATGRESTSYWCKVPSTHFELAFDVLADMLRNSTLRCDRARQGAQGHLRGNPLRAGCPGGPRPRPDRPARLGR